MIYSLVIAGNHRSRESIIYSRSYCFDWAQSYVLQIIYVLIVIQRWLFFFFFYIHLTELFAFVFIFYYISLLL